MIGTLKTKDYIHFTVEGPLEPITFEGAPLAGKAFPGDTVEWDGSKVARILKRVADEVSTPLFLVGTLELSAKVRYGMTSRGAPIYRFTPFSNAYPPFFVGCSKKETTYNLLCRIEFDQWSDTTCPKGNLIQVFGNAGDLKAEEDALAAHYGPVRWKKGDMKPLIKPISLISYFNEPIKCFHIDPPGCLDIDDAISLEKIAEGHWKVGIHIANVGSWILANPWLAEKAAAIGQTLYKDGAAIRPMFPLELSEGDFSLLPGKIRQTVSLTFSWKEGSGGILDSPTWSVETIQVQESYTYESAANCPHTTILSSITNNTDPHKWIEELMLFYNKEAAKVVKETATGILRTHSAPDQERLERYRALGLPVEKIAYQAASYALPTDDNITHWGLKASIYCTASSPIRRWADCINQLVLLSRLGQGGYLLSSIKLGTETIEHLQTVSKASKAFQRDVDYSRILLEPAAPGRLSAIKAVVVEPDRLWVPSWDRLIKATTSEKHPGEEVTISVFCDATQRNWKKRLVVRCTTAI